MQYSVKYIKVIKLFPGHSEASPARSFFDFADEANVMDLHGFFDGFTHVVDGQSGHRDSSQRLHFDAGTASGLDAREDIDALGARRERDFDCSQRQWMTEWDEVGGFFGGHDAGDPCNGQDIAFGQPSSDDQITGLWRHDDLGGSDGGALLIGFCTDVDHVCVPCSIQMCQFRHQRRSRLFWVIFYASRLYHLPCFW